MPRRSRSSSRSVAKPIPRTFQTCRFQWSSCLGRGEYVLELPGPAGSWTLWTCGERLHTFDGAESALSGPDHAAPVEGGAFRNAEPRTAPTSSTIWPDTAPIRRTTRPRSSGRCGSRRRHCYSKSHVGERFDGIVTGASDKGTWVRIDHPAAEGRVVRGYKGFDVGDHVTVELVGTDVERGFVDFAGGRK